MADWSQTWTWFDGGWHEGNPGILGPRSHAFWLGSSVFDGARAFEGVTPDLDLHLERVNASATALLLKPTMSVGEMTELTLEGVKKFPSGTPLYIRPMYWAEQGGSSAVAPDADSTRFLLCLYEAPMPEVKSYAITVSPFRRPTIETMPTNAKAGCLYPNNARAILRAKEKGFDNALVLDMLGNVAELGSSNVFMVKDGTVVTPRENRTFLAGITRTRTMALLEAAGHRVEATTLSVADFMDADEIFSTGNMGKVLPVTRIEDRDLQPGPVFEKARRLYWDYAHA
ncbi:branched-chain amino acid aminotransferase [Acuticoccus sp. I52.16.1]|uniref:branched-chain amino acid aminotransferase n=1 Tax=Acuticoccus sp. I52.16.1 TaxID=2928472 RepID=UPI001FD46BBC|nr:branched-chain amino acid aminotransferase [Acuticoccus sp. I52.16.1]UOM34336.1 branched-chain amino acid aminotransferase [Acuticoccus sp. I52.16.1]